MMMTKTRAHRVRRISILVAAAALMLAVSAPALAQQQTTEEGLNTIMSHRQDISRRAVEETKQRRFEEGKSDSNFPSDAMVGTKGGVVRALTPEEQKAIRHNERGLDLFSKGKLDGAIKEYQEAIRSDQKLAAAHNNLGSAHFAAGRYEEAKAAFRRACELEPDFGQAFFNLALTHIKVGQVKEANEMLDAAIHAYNMAGEAHMKGGRFKQAEEAYRGMLQVDPEYAPALVKLGLIYNTLDRYEEAAQHLRRVTAREPSNAVAHEFLAESLYGLKKYEESVASADRALKLSRDFVDAHYIAGLARASLGQRDAALVHLTRLKELDAADLTQQLAEFINRKAPAKR